MPRASSSGDEQWMRRAIELAWRGAGGTRPNPPVGCVVVRDGRRVGEGYHRKAGGPHAEIHALRQAGPLARGATLFVTLEPCCTQGRTGPCTEAILGSGVRRVVVACRDPNPLHNGRGVRRLISKGIRVTENVCAPEGLLLIRPFARWMTSGRPFVTLKMAMTLDGRIADAAGKSKWITGAASRTLVRRMRDRVDAIMVGSGTVRADNPSLLPRSSRRKPWRVVLDASGRLPPETRVLTDAFANRTIVVTTSQCPASRAAQYGAHGATVIKVRTGRQRRVSPKAALRVLASMGVLHVLCEGGGELAASLIRERLADEMLFFVAPKLLGGGGSAPVVAGAGWLLPGCPEMRFVSCRGVGRDLLITAEPRWSKVEVQPCSRG